MKMLRALVLSATLALCAFAGDVDGTWKTKFESPDGQTRENTLVLKSDGEKLTGTLSSRMGDAKIENGTIKGDAVAFTVVRNFNGEDVTFKYNGKITGNTMKLKVSVGDRDFDMTATKQP